MNILLVHPKLESNFHDDVNLPSNGRVGKVDLPLLKKIQKAGCRLIQYGVESGDQEILDKSKKQITIEQVKEIFGLGKKAGLRTVANFMVRNPAETKKSIQNACI